jgi:hypothetical protein
MTQTLKEIWASNKNIRVYECLVLTHPLFDSTFYLVNDTQTKNFNGVDYQPCPFKITLPEKGSNQQDVSIVLPNIGIDIIKQLDNAIEDIYEPIKTELQLWIDGASQPEAVIPNLEFTNISVDKTTVSGVGMRKDLYGHYVLENAIFDIRFEGLWI